MIFLGVFLGWFETARGFVLDRLPLLVALAVAWVALLTLMVRRRFRQVRRRRAQQRVLDAEVASTDGLTGPEIERVFARLLERDGYTRVRISGGSGDLGADVMATAVDGTRVVIQCKRYAQQPSVTSPDMQKVLGTCFHEHGADHA